MPSQKQPRPLTTVRISVGALTLLRTMAGHEDRSPRAVLDRIVGAAWGDHPANQQVRCSNDCTSTWDGYILHEPECVGFDAARWDDYIAYTVEEPEQETRPNETRQQVMSRHLG